MVRKDRSVFRKWEKKGGKRRSETQRETGREIRLQRFSAGAPASLLGLLDLTQSHISQDGIHQ